MIANIKGFAYETYKWTETCEFVSREAVKASSVVGVEQSSSYKVDGGLLHDIQFMEEPLEADLNRWDQGLGDSCLFDLEQFSNVYE